MLRLLQRMKSRLKRSRNPCLQTFVHAILAKTVSSKPALKVLSKLAAACATICLACTDVTSATIVMGHTAARLYLLQHIQHANESVFLGTNKYE